MSYVDLRSKTILVTGVAGFINSNLVKRLYEGVRSVTVIGIDNMNDYYNVRLKEARLSELSAHPSFTSIQGSTVDKELISRVSGQYRPRIVVNLAAQAGIRYPTINPDTYIESGLVGSYNILEACRHSFDDGHAPVEHLVYASSSSVYGSNKKVPYSTDDKVDSPVSLYTAMEESNELTVHAYTKLYNIPSAGLGFFTVYGPAGRLGMAYFGFTDRLKAGKTIQIFNYGNCKRDLTCIDGVVTGVERVMTKAPDRTIGEDGIPVPLYALYDIGNNHPENLLDFMQMLSGELVGTGALSEDYDFDIHKELSPMQPGDVPVTYADTSALEHDFGLGPSIDLRSGSKRFTERCKELYV